MAKVRRIDVGFAGGQSLTLRATESNWDEIVKALGDEGAGRILTVRTEDSEVALDLAQVVFVRRETDEHKVGF
jgi:hypothetical protein